MKKLYILSYVFNLLSINIIGQGLNHNWFIGYNTIPDQYTVSGKGKIEIGSNSIAVLPQSRYMPMNNTQANISDSNGTILIYTNGCWIANTLGDTVYKWK
ncbi:MAG: hypothetical protein IPP29_25165 [Bacteroidetes bacterium]|nr:hypothetical protein [Bacteroidota bacterium]